MSDLASRFQQLCQQIEAHAQQAGRDCHNITLVAVSKTRSASEIRAVADLGQRHFGENYLQEALEKQAQLTDLTLTWHFIGPIQSNKTRDIASHFHWVHSVDRAKIAQRLNDQRPENLGLLNVCIQVNVDNEASKGGVTLPEVPELAAAILALPNLRLRGLMAIPSASSDDRNRYAFEQLAMTLSQMRHRMPDGTSADAFGLDTLSMGMSNDFDVAIATGATHIRVGTALFGPRPAKP